MPVLIADYLPNLSDLNPGTNTAPQTGYEPESESQGNEARVEEGIKEGQIEAAIQAELAALGVSRETTNEYGIGDNEINFQPVLVDGDLEDWMVSFYGGAQDGQEVASSFPSNGSPSMDNTSTTETNSGEIVNGWRDNTRAGLIDSPLGDNPNTVDTATIGVDAVTQDAETTTTENWDSSLYDPLGLLEDLFGTGAAQGGFSIFGSPPPAGYGVEELQKLYVDAILDQISDGTIDVADVNLEVLKSIGATEDQIAAAGANTTTAENSQDINRSDVGPLSEENTGNNPLSNTSGGLVGGVVGTGTTLTPEQQAILDAETAAQAEAQAQAQAQAQAAAQAEAQAQAQAQAAAAAAEAAAEAQATADAEGTAAAEAAAAEAQAQAQAQAQAAAEAQAQAQAQAQAAAEAQAQAQAQAEAEAQAVLDAETATGTTLTPEEQAVLDAENAASGTELPPEGNKTLEDTINEILEGDGNAQEILDVLGEGVTAEDLRDLPSSTMLQIWKILANQLGNPAAGLMKESIQDILNNRMRETGEVIAVVVENEDGVREINTVRNPEDWDKVPPNYVTAEIGDPEDTTFFEKIVGWFGSGSNLAPILLSAGLGGLVGLFTPDQEDIIKATAKEEERALQRGNQRIEDSGGIYTGIGGGNPDRGSGLISGVRGPLRDNFGNLVHDPKTGQVAGSRLGIPDGPKSFAPDREPVDHMANIKARRKTAGLISGVSYQTPKILTPQNNSAGT